MARTGWRGWVLAAPLGVYLVLFVVVPSLIFFVYSFWRVENYSMVPAMTLQNYVRIFTEPAYRTLALRSLAIGLVAGVLTCLAAFPVSYVLAFKAGRFRDLLLFLVLLTLFMSYLVRIYAWRSILSSSGLVDSILVGLGLSGEHQSYLLFTPVGTLLALVNVYIPFAVLPIYAALLNIPSLVHQAARDLGASPLKVFVDITIPLSSAGLAAAFAFVFLLSTGDYVTPALVGGTDGSMIGTSIQEQFGGNFNWPLGSALAFSFGGILLVVLALLALAARRSGVLRAGT